MDIFAIPREAIGFMLPAVGPHLMRGLLKAIDQDADGVQSVEEVFDDLGEGLAQLWVVIDDDRIIGTFLTALVDDIDEKKAVDVYALAGEGLARWGEMLSDTMAAYAKHNDACRVIFIGRKALRKIYSGVRIVGEHSPGVFRFERVVQ